MFSLNPQKINYDEELGRGVSDVVYPYQEEAKKVEEAVTQAQRKESEDRQEMERKEKQRLMEVIEQRKQKLLGGIISEETCPNLMAQETFACTAIDFYNAVFSERKVTHKGKTFDCFWVLVKHEATDKDLEYTPWSPKPPYEGLHGDKDSLECLKQIAEGAEKGTRGIGYTHPVDGGPFVPKSSHVEEKQTAYWLSASEFIITMEVQTSKIPLSDCFFTRNFFRVKEIPGPKVEFTWKLGIEFVKSTMFKGKITKTTQDENLSQATKVHIPLLKQNLAEYLKEKASY